MKKGNVIDVCYLGLQREIELFNSFFQGVQSQKGGFFWCYLFNGEVGIVLCENLKYCQKLVFV